MDHGKLSNPRQVCSVSHYCMQDGPMQGMHITDCVNGKLRFLLNDGKALDIMQVYFEGENLSFISKNGFMARELPFGKRFEGGMLYTCGLDGVGGVEGVEVHGSLHSTPATVTRRECTDGGILVEGYIRDSALFGKNLVLKRSFFSPYGSASIQIRDTLINEGEREEDFALLYHINLGYPLLDEGGRIEVNVGEVTPRNAFAAQHLAAWKQIGAPKKDFEEACYYLFMNEGRIAYLNERTGKRLTLTYDKEAMPRFVVWKSECCGDYALGLEPATTELDERFAYRSIKPGECISFDATIKMDRI